MRLASAAGVVIHTLKSFSTHLGKGPIMRTASRLLFVAALLAAGLTTAPRSSAQKAPDVPDTVEVLRDRAAKSLTIVVVERKDKEMRVGALDDGMPGMRWKSRAPHAFVAPLPSDMSGLEERLDEIDKRLRELEGRKPGQ